MSYFKKSPAWAQLLMFIGLAAGCFIILSLVGTLILSKITGISIMEMSKPEEWDYNSPSLLPFLRGMLIIQFFSLFVIPVFLFARMVDKQPSQYLGLRSSTGFYIITGIAVLIVALPFVDFTGIINHKLIPESAGIGKWMKAAEEDAAKQIKFMLTQKGTANLLLNLVFVAVFAGVGEELFFRGVLQRLFIKIFKSPWAGIIVTAVIFSAIHLQFYGFLPRLVLGILLGLIYWYSGSLWAAIIAHFAYDAMAVVLIHFNPSMADENTVTASFGNQTVLAAVSLALVVWLVLWMKKKSTNSYQTVYSRDAIDDSNPFL